MAQLNDAEAVIKEEAAEVTEPVSEPVPKEAAEAAPEPKQNRKAKFTDGMELQDYLFLGAIVAAVIAFLFVLISQAALNGQGYYQLQLPWMKEAIKFEFMTAALAGWIAGGFGLVSLGCGIGRNIIRRKNRNTINILPGIVMVVLAAICLLAVRFAK